MNIGDHNELLIMHNFYAQCRIRQVEEHMYTREYDFMSDIVRKGSLGESWVHAWIERGYVELISTHYVQRENPLDDSDLQYHLKITEYGISVFLMSFV